VFNVALLAARLTAATRWLCGQPDIGAIPVGYFGVGTGAAAALVSATGTPRLPVTAVVSLGGRPDLVGGRLPLVRTPTLLIAGGADTVVLGLNQRALARFECESRLAVVPGATHMFEAPGALGRVTDLASGWFARHFAQAGAIAPAA
jgi:putative phosphoribosyl transferase